MAESLFACALIADVSKATEFANIENRNSSQFILLAKIILLPTVKYSLYNRFHGAKKQLYFCHCNRLPLPSVRKDDRDRRT